MKRKLLTTLLFVSLFVGCEKAKYENTGTITGADLRKCMCCGGYFVDINDTQYQFEKSELPDNFTFEDSQLPLVVELNWELKTDGCSGFNRISISKIRFK
jgi:hypothetical protein